MMDSVLFAAKGSAADLLSIVQEDGVHELLDMHPGCELPDDAAVATLARLLGCGNDAGEGASDPSAHADDDEPRVEPAPKRFHAILEALATSDLDRLATRWCESHAATVPPSERKAWKDPAMHHQLRATLDELAQLAAAIAHGNTLFLATEP